MSNIDRINSYEDACQIKGIQPRTISDFSFLPEEDREAQFASHQLDTIISVVNKGRKFDYNNRLQKKHFPWLVWTGSGFALTDVVYVRTSSGVGPRRSFFSEEDCRETVEKFIHLYNKSYKQ